MQLTSFVGRRLRRWTSSAHLADNRLVTLTGAGGAGKTRLAIEVAGRMTSDFPTGSGTRTWRRSPIPVVPVAVAARWACPTNPVSRSRDTCCASSATGTCCSSSTTANTCSMPAPHSSTTCWRPARGDDSRDQPRTPWRRGRGDLAGAVAVTDRRGDRIVHRPRPPGQPGFRRDRHNAAIVTEICRRLDGMPLAIELAAARVRALTLAEIVDSLHDRFRLLTGGARTAVRRQQTLRASVDWSHALLTEPERVLFRRLAVFMGGFDLDAAQAVAGGHRGRTLPGARPTQPACRQVSGRRRKPPMAERDTGCWRPCASTRWSSSASPARPTRCAPPPRSLHGDGGAVGRPGRDDYEQLLVQAEPISTIYVRPSSGAGKTTMSRRRRTWRRRCMPIWLTRGRLSEGLAWLNAAGADRSGQRRRLRHGAGNGRQGRSELVGRCHRRRGPAQEALAIARESTSLRC